MNTTKKKEPYIDIEYLAGTKYFSKWENLKYRIHCKVSSIFGDAEYLEKKLNLSHDYLPLADLIPTILYDDNNECFINEQTIGFVLEGNTIASANGDTVKTITNLLSSEIPEGVIIQVTNVASPKLDEIFNHYKNSRTNAKEIYQTLTQKRINHFKPNNWKSLFKQPYLMRDFKLIITVSMPINSQEGDSILDKIVNIKNIIRKGGGGGSKRNNKQTENYNKYHNDDLHHDYEKINTELLKRQLLSHTNSNIKTQEDLYSLLSKIDKKAIKLNKLKQALKSTLNSIGVFVKEQKEIDLITYLDEIINPNKLNEERFPIRYRKDGTVKKQITKGDNLLAVDKDYITLYADDNKRKVRVKSFNVKTFPQHFALWQQEDLIGEQYNELSQIPCPFITTFTIKMPNNWQSRQAKMQAKGLRAMQQAETPLAKYMPELKEKSEDFAFVTRHLREGQKTVDTYFQITLLSPPEKLEEATQILTSIYKKKSFQLIAEKYMHLQSFMSIIPFNMGEGIFEDLVKGRRTDTMLTWTCANIMPLLGEDYGYTSSPCMMLFGRRGQPLFWNPFSNQGGNYNTAVVGKSGSGKSVFMQELVTSLLGFV
jgi:hypothetical protein